MPAIHPYYEAHRTVMEASMRQRLDIVSEMFEARLGQTEAVAAKQEIMSEFEVVFGQMPYVGGATSRMSDFFMRLMGFMAIGRVLQRRGVPTDTIGEIELESFQRQMLTVPEDDRMQAGRQFMSPENRALMREQAAESQKKLMMAISFMITSNLALTMISNLGSTTAPADFANLLAVMAIWTS
jgi:hypothetical protein